MGLKETILNQLCFDDDTIANNKLQSFKLNKDEKQLIELYDIVLREAKKTEKYNSTFKYGIYQIENELNTFYKDSNDNKV